MSGATNTTAAPAQTEKRAQTTPNVLLIFNLLWDDAKALLLGISRYVDGRWHVRLDVDAASVNDLSWINENKWDGIITRHTSPELLDLCQRLRIPIVDLNDEPGPQGLPKIRPDNRAVGHMGAEHFLERGFKHFAFCGLRETWSKERELGFSEALRLAGMDCHTIDAAYDPMNASWNERQQRELMQWLASLPRPLAVFACNDLRALQVTEACRAAGYLVPTEVSVLGVNNDYVRCAFGTPPLSSVATDRQLAGFRAAELLERLMAERKFTSEEDIRIDPIRVVVRRSTDVLAIDDQVVRAALHYIQEFACKGISAEDVAARVGLSRHALERKFRQLCGRSPHMEIRAIQIARIKQLLIETDLPLKNVADLVGVPHTEYVSVMFNRYVGMPPGAYRKKHQPKIASGHVQSSIDPDAKEDA
ncbi:MAG TPA: DNA-binding transcriptional regulator [Opitutaceae bacterium]|nr:DNA-binding transcriptional regulator [Opitutaceae bacterium]